MECPPSARREKSLFVGHNINIKRRSQHQLECLDVNPKTAPSAREWYCRVEEFGVCPGVISSGGGLYYWSIRYNVCPKAIKLVLGFHCQSRSHKGSSCQWGSENVAQIAKWLVRRDNLGQSTTLSARESPRQLEGQGFMQTAEWSIMSCNLRQRHTSGREAVPAAPVRRSHRQSESRNFSRISAYLVKSSNEEHRNIGQIAA